MAATFFSAPVVVRASELTVASSIWPRASLHSELNTERRRLSLSPDLEAQLESMLVILGDGLFWEATGAKAED